MGWTVVRAVAFGTTFWNMMRSCLRLLAIRTQYNKHSYNAENWNEPNNDRLSKPLAHRVQVGPGNQQRNRSVACHDNEDRNC